MKYKRSKGATKPSTIATHLAVALAPLEKKLVVHPSRRNEMERAMMVGNV
jgi:hypothetical protein